MNLPNFAVKRPITIVMAVLIVVLLGGISLSRIAVDLYPEIKLPVAAVFTTYQGAGPKEVEEMVTKPLEEMLGTVNGVDQITSQTTEGSSTGIVWFNWGTDMDFATLKLREQVDFSKSFMPEDVSDPMVMQMDPAMMPILQTSISGGENMANLERIAKDDISPRLERLEGVASVYLTGGVSREIKIQVNPVKLEQYGLTLSQITQVLRAENINMSTGSVTEGKREYFVRTLGEYEQVSDIGNVVLNLPQGGIIRLSDVADIVDGHKEQSQLTRMNHQPSIGLHIQKQSEANTVQVAEEVKKVLAELEQEIDGDIQVDIVFDQSEFINQAMGSVVNNTIVGGIFAVLVLFLFLRNFRSTVIIALAIPISIISTFSLIYFNDLTLNMMSMGGLALGVGMMVDSSIVILENIFRYRQDGYSMLEAATEGSNEVASAVVASTLTTIAVFLPIVFVEGIAAQLFKQLALTVSFALGAALLVSLTLIPMLASKLLVITNGNGNGGGTKRKNVLRRSMDVLGRALNRLTDSYSRTLAWALGHRKTVVAGVTVLLLASFGLVPLVGVEFLPKMDASELSVNIELAKGSLLAETDEVTRQVEAILEDTPEVSKIFTSVGSAQGQVTGMGGAQKELASIRVMLADKEQRSRSADAVADEVRNKLGGIAGAEVKVAAVDPTAMNGVAAPVAVNIKGDDLEVLEKFADRVIEVVESVPGTREVESSFTKGSPELQLKIDRDKAASYGISVGQLATVVKTALQGQVATKYRVEDSEVDIRVVYPEWARENVQDLSSLTVPSPMGFNVPVSELVTMGHETGPGTIGREDQVRMATVTSDISGRDLGSITTDIETELKQLRRDLPKGYEITIGGEQEEMMKAFDNLSLALVLAIILVYMVMASQFESLMHPFVIMFSLPTTFIGVVAGMVLTGRHFSVTSFIGIIMLAGIVVNNAIVLVDYINTLRAKGKERNEAVLEAGPVRLRPILMTTLTTSLALLPTAAGVGSGSEASAPMAVAVVSGLIVSMVFTLVLVPVIYTIVDDIGQKVRGRVERRRAAKLSASKSV